MADGLYCALPDNALKVIVNTGDDFQHLGLYVCPDIDTNIYTLAGVNDDEHGWGRAQESYSCRQELANLGAPDWFTLGDKDIALHLLRTHLLRQEKLTLTAATSQLASRFGIKAEILPMCDEAVPTLMHTGNGTFGFQEYFVKRKCQDKVCGITFSGIETARLTPAVCRALEANVLIFAPSNCFVSLDPILAVPGVRDRINRSKALRLGVSPIICGKAVKGPLAGMMQSLGLEVSAFGIAKYYADLLDIFVIDESDAELAPQIEELGLKVLAMPIIMKGSEGRKKLGLRLAEACGLV